MPNVLVADLNVDNLFFELPERVTKIINTGIGFVEGVTQNVIITEGTTVPGFLAFNRPEADTGDPHLQPDAGGRHGDQGWWHLRLHACPRSTATTARHGDPETVERTFALNFASSSAEMIRYKLTSRR